MFITSSREENKIAYIPYKTNCFTNFKFIRETSKNYVTYKILLETNTLSVILSRLLSFNYKETKT